MQKYYRALYVGLVFVLAAPSAKLLAAGDHDNFVVRHDQTVVIPADVRRVLELKHGSENARKFFNNQKVLEETASNFFVVRKMSDLLDETRLDPESAWRLREQVDRIRSRAYIDYRLQQHGEPRYETLAYERYLVNQSLYVAPPSVDLLHFRVENELPPRIRALSAPATEAEFRRLVDDVKDAIGDPVVLNDLPGVLPGQLESEIDREIFSSVRADGERLIKVETRTGTHFVWILRRNAQRTLPFEEVKAQLISDERAKYRQEFVSELVSEISTLKGVELRPEFLSDVSKVRQEVGISSD